MSSRSLFRWHRRSLTVLLVSLAAEAAAQAIPGTPSVIAPEAPRSDLQRDHEIAAHFAPVFHQALGSSPRFDYITRFDFDGDWRGDNNWLNAGDPKFRLDAWVYYSVIESDKHIFVHYALFHPRDYKGGVQYGALLSEIIRAGVLLGAEYDPTGRASEAVLAHENDLEGVLVVAEKDGLDLSKSRPVLIETLAHNTFLPYAPAGSPVDASAVEMLGVSAVLFVEPMGHGIQALRNDGLQRRLSRNGVIVYKYAGEAGHPREKSMREVSYDLLPLITTLWPRAAHGQNETYGEVHDYGAVSLRVQTLDGTVDRRIDLGVRGSALRGTVGARNVARPPWAWFDGFDRERRVGEWFLDPAETLRRRFSTNSPDSYTYHPFLGLHRSSVLKPTAPAAGQTLHQQNTVPDN